MAGEEELGKWSKAVVGAVGKRRQISEEGQEAEPRRRVSHD